jgi:hypothetical protein
MSAIAHLNCKQTSNSQVKLNVLLVESQVEGLEVEVAHVGILR